MNLSKKTVVITGASMGLGKALALKLCTHGADLVILARSENLLREVQIEALRLSGKLPFIIACDLADDAAVSRAAEAIGNRYPRVDVLVNNAGVGIHKTLEDMSCEEMRRQCAVNCLGPFYCVKALLPLLKRSDSAYVVNVGSLAGGISFVDNYLYALTKAWTARFSFGVHRELSKYGIRVGLFLPGLLRTSFNKEAEGGKPVPPFMMIDPEKAAEEIIGMIEKRKKERYLYRWMLLPMRMRQVCGGIS